MVNHTSRSLAPVEQRYSQIEGESLAIEYGVLSNRMYLLGIKFKVVTDHKPLVSILGTKELGDVPNMCLFRLKERTALWWFNIIHMPGKRNGATDSRQECQMRRLPAWRQWCSSQMRCNASPSRGKTSRQRRRRTRGIKSCSIPSRQASQTSRAERR